MRSKAFITNMGEIRNVHRILDWKAGRDDQLGA